MLLAPIQIETDLFSHFAQDDSATPAKAKLAPRPASERSGVPLALINLSKTYHAAGTEKRRPEAGSR